MPTCLECNRSFTARNYDSRFCGQPCRLKFNNRRQARGMELYDAIMAREFDNDPQAKDISTHIKALLRAYRTSDEKKRAGRKSWLPWKHTRVRRPGGYGVEGDGR